MSTKIDLKTRMKNLGHKSVKAGLIALMKKHGGDKGLVADEIGVSTSYLNRNLRETGITQNVPAKEVWIRKLDDYNAKNGTSYGSTREWLSALYDQYGSRKATEITGAPQNYVCQCARVWEKVKKGVLVEPSYRLIFTDTRPGNVPATWVDPDKSPCRYPCNFILRNKNEPGCERCERRLEYVALTEGGLLTNGSIEPSNCQVQHSFREYSMMP
jgi:hypothetical protein